MVDGWLDELIGSFDLFPKAGFVGSKLLNPDGSLQEAGGLYWSDGTAWNYGRGADSCDPRYNFARRVDWLSGAAIALPMAVWNALGGFDPAYRPAYCEDTDLAFRVRDSGREVWYQPLSCVVHFEGMTHGRDETAGIKAYQVANLKRLQQRWKDRLPGKREGGVEPDREANRSAEKTMLVIDAQTHTPDRDAGSVIGWQMTKAFRELGFHQTYVALDDFRPLGDYTKAYQRVGVQTLHSPFFNNFDDVLRFRNDFDYVLVSRYHVAQEVIDRIRAHMPTTRIIFVPADLHHLRMERQALLEKDGTLRVQATRVKTEELRVFSQVDCSIPHTPVEKNLIRQELPMLHDNIVVFPWIATPVESSAELGPRKDIMFLGGFPHTPNVDAAVFFVREVWPLLVDRLPSDARFVAVGASPPDVVRSLASERIVVTGQVPRLEPHFAQSRVFVAPLRFGAGIKGKVIESLSHGVPTVASTIAVEGIGLTDGENCFVADTPEAMAEAVLRLYADPEAWTRMREAGFRFVDENYSWRRAMELCQHALDVADETWIEREARARATWLKGLAQAARREGIDASGAASFG